MSNSDFWITVREFFHVPFGTARGRPPMDLSNTEQGDHPDRGRDTGSSGTGDKANWKRGLERWRDSPRRAAAPRVFPLVLSNQRPQSHPGDQSGGHRVHPSVQ